MTSRMSTWGKLRWFCLAVACVLILASSLVRYHVLHLHY